MERDTTEEIGVDVGFSKVPLKFTCDGEDISPRIILKGAKGASLCLIMDDPDAPGGVFTHWIAWNIDPVEEIPEGMPKSATVDRPIKAVQGRNGFNRIGYNGPCPPRGRPHRYFIKVFVLDSRLSLPPGASRSELERATQGKIVQTGQAMATYARA
jgi:Raf kinase inhibitor-like YbhB/YbcL family protein